MHHGTTNTASIVKSILAGRGWPSAFSRPSGNSLNDNFSGQLSDAPSATGDSCKYFLHFCSPTYKAFFSLQLSHCPCHLLTQFYYQFLLWEKDKKGPKMKLNTKMGPKFFEKYQSRAKDLKKYQFRARLFKAIRKEGPSVKSPCKNRC